MDGASKQRVVDNYRNKLLKFKEGPAVGGWSLEGQLFRFERLVRLGQLDNFKILDLGCGIGDFYTYLTGRYNKIRYTGIDIVPELIAYAKDIYPNANFLCHDILQTDPIDNFDYAFISGMFNNGEISNCTAFLKKIVATAFQHCSRGLAFNFISTYVNYSDSEMAYHDPVEIFDFCIKNLSKKVMIDHHYERCDVAVFVYK